jgi:diguanylate cyclase (GGDEF)-like protein
MSLRVKFSVAFSLIAGLTIALGCYGIQSLSLTRDLVVRLYDQPLMGVSYARAASASLNEARGLMNCNLPSQQGRLPDVVAALDRTEADIAEDLQIVRQRVQDPAVVSALDRATASIANWFASERMIFAPRPGGVTALPTRISVERQSSVAAAALEDLVEQVSAAGFSYRARAEAEMHAASLTVAGLVGGIMVTSLLFGLLFASVLGPIRTATEFAEDIAAGNVATMLSTNRRDEIGRLLQCLAAMQTNLQARAAQAQAFLRDQEQAAGTLRQINLRFDTALNNMSHGLLMYDAGATVTVVNRRFCEIYRLDRDLIVPGLSYRELLALSIAAGNHPDRTVDELMAEDTPILRPRRPGVATRAISGGRTIAISYEPMPDGGWLSTHEDISERCKSLEQIAFLARHDPLTHLPNRVLFQERLEEGLADLGDSEFIALLCLDLDQFKMVNDTLGHPIGDQLLVAVAERVQGEVRLGDIVARLGGDEFAVIQFGIESDDDASALAGRIIRVVSKPYDLDHHRVTIGVSIGIAMAPVDGRQRQELMRKADLALYSAKRQGRGTWRMFHSALDDVVQSRRKMEYSLRNALRARQFELHYQPVVNTRTRRLSGFEALLRWNHPTRGMIPPGEFIPLAEETGLITEIGAWVIDQACAQAATWSEDLTVAVNLSAVQFRGDLVRTVADAIDAHDLTPERLMLEITESVLLQQNPSTLSTLHVLRGLGVRVAMDDFGTGYSSLSYLRSFPFDTIKIDQSFVRGLELRDERAAIIRAVIGLSKSLRIRTIAEGVETAEQLEILTVEGCTEVQGYFFSKPVPVEMLPGLITTLTERLTPAVGVTAPRVEDFPGLSV